LESVETTPPPELELVVVAELLAVVVEPDDELSLVVLDVEAPPSPVPEAVEPPPVPDVEESPPPLQAARPMAVAAERQRAIANEFKCFMRTAP